MTERDYKMFDNAIAKTNVNFENRSASGLLCKTMIKSKIIEFDKGTNWENTILSFDPYVRDGYNNKIRLVVLQVLLASNTSYIVECITVDDYNEELGINKGELK